MEVAAALRVLAVRAHGAGEAVETARAALSTAAVGSWEGPAAERCTVLLEARRASLARCALTLAEVSADAASLAAASAGVRP